MFLESVTFQFHARMLSSEVAQSLKSYGHFSDLGVEIALSHRHVGCFGYRKYIHPRPRRGRHGSATPVLIPVQTAEQLQYIQPVLIKCWASVADVGPTLKQQWVIFRVSVK